MSRYLTERYCPGATEAGAREAMQRLQSSCAALAETGVPVTFLGGSFLPSDEAMNCRFDGTAQAVRAAHAMASVPLDRLVAIRELQRPQRPGVSWTWWLVAAVSIFVFTACTPAPHPPAVSASHPVEQAPPTGAAGASSAGPTGPSAAGGSNSPGTASPSSSSAASGSATSRSAASTPEELPELPPLSAPEFVPANRTDQLKVEIDRSGTSLQVAIDVFDLTIAPMPGATPSSMPPGPGFSPTYALALITRVRRELSPAQLQVLDSVRDAGVTVGRFDATGKSASVSSSSATISYLRAQVPNYPPAMVARYNRLFEKALDDWRRYRPELLADTAGYSVAFTGFQLRVKGADAEMSTLPEADPRYCGVTVYPALYDHVFSDAFIAFVFAHELFHCAQFSWNGALALPQWLVEGSAEFAARDLYRTTLLLPPAEDIPEWFTKTVRSLATRAYDAWALFETFKSNYGADPYPAIEKMIKTVNGDTAGLLSAGTMDNPIFQSMWTSGTLRATTFDDAYWQLRWPNGDPAHGPHNTAITLPERGIGTYPVVGKKDFVHQQYLVPLASTVGLIGVVPDGGPMLTHADVGTVGVAEGSKQWFCTDVSRCVCPAGMEPTVDLVILTPPMIFSFAARQNASTAAVTAMKWDPAKYCAKKSHKPVNFRGSSNGDPHIRTFDGLTYDFMPLGEFVATQDPQDGLAVQERHQPAGFGTSISAVAVGTGAHRVTLTAHDFSSTAAILVRMDGKAVDATEFTAGEVKVMRHDRMWTFTWPDGSVVTADWEDEFFLKVSLAPDRAGRAVGLLGSGDGNFLNDQSLPDGSRAVPGADPAKGFDGAWLVGQSGSLFDYEPGESTETFRKAPPRRATAPTPNNVQSCRQSLGEQATNFEVHSCAYDVTATGQTHFIASYRQITADRVAELPAAIPVTGSSATPESDAPSTPQQRAPGSPVLTVSGVLARTRTADAAGSLEGLVRLSAGTVLLIKATCPADPSFDLAITATAKADRSGARVTLCGTSAASDRYNAGPTDDTPPGEGYLLIRESTDYDLVVATGSENAAFVSVDLYADSTPTIVTDDDTAGQGYQGTLTDVADTVLIWVRPGDKGGSWLLEGAAQACAAEFYGPAITDQGANNLSGICRHHREVSIGPFSEQVPLVIFNRTQKSVPISVKRR